MHLRKCQCREKTPPCRNCPKCKYIADIMTITDVQAQQSMCQIRFKCEICSCKCAAALCNDHLRNSQSGCHTKCCACAAAPWLANCCCALSHHLAWSSLMREGGWFRVHGISCVAALCRCPGAGKWVESDEASRESYERRTAARHTQLQGLGWNASAKLSFSFSQSPPPQVWRCPLRALYLRIAFFPGVVKVEVGAFCLGVCFRGH